MYDTKFRQWNLFKSIRRSEYEYMLRKKRLRAGVLKDTQFVLRGKPVSLARLQRYADRNRVNFERLIYGISRSDDVVRQAVECITPPASPLPVPDVYNAAMKFRCLMADVLSCSPNNEDSDSGLMWRAESRRSERYRLKFGDKLTSTRHLYQAGEHDQAIVHMGEASAEVGNIIKHWDCYTFVDWLDCLQSLYSVQALDKLHLLQAHAKSWSEATLLGSDLRRHLLTILAEIDISQLQQAIEDVELLLLDKLDEYRGDTKGMYYRAWIGQTKLRDDRTLAVDDYLPTREAAATRFGTESYAYDIILEAHFDTFLHRKCYVEAVEVAQQMLDAALDAASVARNYYASIFRASRAYRYLSQARFCQGSHWFEEARTAARQALSLYDEYYYDELEDIPPLCASELFELVEMLETIAKCIGDEEGVLRWAVKLVFSLQPQSPDCEVVWTPDQALPAIDSVALERYCRRRHETNLQQSSHHWIGNAGVSCHLRAA